MCGSIYPGRCHESYCEPWKSLYFMLCQHSPPAPFHVLYHLLLSFKEKVTQLLHLFLSSTYLSLSSRPPLPSSQTPSPPHTCCRLAILLPPIILPNPSTPHTTLGIHYISVYILITHTFIHLPTYPPTHPHEQHVHTHIPSPNPPPPR